ncbi:MAG TPA: DUF2442 domain-containing protein [Promineifilum sp.]|nr:DUF2442 domain-containing protein [Promineifilum sp.]HRO24708.1 DUF2442 domain-containing protein [Promineifilum sp.]HRO89027.1 DUF2442 domain-containing protein [Promineifilum sp.]HRQ12213.1 DUF2442 domain-containing protein [Promineifilum sp.]
MFPRITHVQHVRDYILHLKFTNGEEADIDLESRIRNRGGVFSPLEKIEYFARVAVDPEAHTLVWPNGVDLDPDVLYSVATGTPLPALQAIQ